MPTKTPSDSGAISRVDLERVRAFNFELFKTEARESLKSANTTSSSILATLITISTVLIVLTATPFFGDVAFSLKIVIFISWFMLFLSIGAGIGQYLVDYYYYRREGRLQEKIANQFMKMYPAEQTLRTDIAAADLLSTESKPNSSYHMFYVQLFTFMLGLLGVIAVASIELFNR